MTGPGSLLPLLKQQALLPMSMSRPCQQAPFRNSFDLTTRSGGLILLRPLQLYPGPDHALVVIVVAIVVSLLQDSFSPDFSIYKYKYSPTILLTDSSTDILIIIHSFAIPQFFKPLQFLFSGASDCTFILSGTNGFL